VGSLLSPCLNKRREDETRENEKTRFFIFKKETYMAKNTPKLEDLKEREREREKRG